MTGSDDVVAGDAGPADMRRVDDASSGNLLVARSGRRAKPRRRFGGCGFTSPASPIITTTRRPQTAAPHPRYRCLVLANYTARRQLARQLLFYSLRHATTIFPLQLFNGEAPDRALLREGWRKLLPRAVADPRNPQSWQGGRGHVVSALETAAGAGTAGLALSLSRFHQRRAALNGAAQRSRKPATSVDLHHRRGWRAESRPLAVLLDGQFWAESMPVLVAAGGADAGRPPAAGGLCADRRYRQSTPRRGAALQS